MPPDIVLPGETRRATECSGCLESSSCTVMHVYSDPANQNQGERVKGTSTLLLIFSASFPCDYVYLGYIR